MSDAPTKMNMPERTPRSGGAAWLHRLSVALLVGTFVLIVAGGNVTSKDAGLAVPDWPLSFGSCNPQGWTSMPLVFDEHLHRLIGTTIGMISILVVAMAFMGSGISRKLRRVSVVALVAVIIQGIMGGLRVTEISTTLAIIHGCFGQVFLCIVVALVAMSSRRWPGTAAPRDALTTRAVRFWTVVIPLAVFGQLILGAVLRHLHIGLGWHIMGAMVVGVVLIMASQHIYNPRPLNPESRRAMNAIFALYGVQLLLGLMTFLVLRPLGSPVTTVTQAYLPTVHVGVGAAILASSVYLALKTYAVTTRQPKDATRSSINEMREVPA